MKVNRQNLTEEYTTTSSWVRDFSNTLVKDADYLSNLRSIMKKRKDFGSIEEKMADLKTRVGFDLIKNVEKSSNSNVKEAGCGCNSCESCSEEEQLSPERKSDLAIVKSIMQYIKDLVEDRPEIGYGAVLSHCREHPQLGFDKVERKLNFKNFKEAVQNILKKHEKDPEAVKYESEAVFDNNEPETADYYTHANG